MVGASPDNIGAQRLAEGGVPASGASSVPSGLSTQWQLTNKKNGPKAVFLRGKKLQRFL
jgi:hypothetical protein